MKVDIENQAINEEKKGKEARINEFKLAMEKTLLFFQQEQKNKEMFG